MIERIYDVTTRMGEISSTEIEFLAPEWRVANIERKGIDDAPHLEGPIGRPQGGGDFGMSTDEVIALTRGLPADEG